MRALLVSVLVSFTSLPAQTDVLFHRLGRDAAAAALVVAHRGASRDYPENTVVAFKAATAAGAAVVEFDVCQTRDGKWVCMHDSTCDRTTDAVARLGRQKVRIDELSLAQIRELDAGTWFDERFAAEPVPTLAEALEAIAPAVPMIERKGGDAAALIAELRRLDVIDRVLVQAFDWAWLQQVHAAEPRLLLGALGGDEPTAARLQAAAQAGARLVHWNQHALDVATAARIRARGDLLCVYTVDSDVGLLGAAAIGCDLITTNRPARLAELRREGLLRRAR